MMDIQVHNIVSVVETINHHTTCEFVTRTFEVTDKDGVKYSFRIFGAKANDLETIKVEENYYDYTNKHLSHTQRLG